MMAKPMEAEIEKSALLIVDMQNDFVHPDGDVGIRARESPDAGIDMPFLTGTIGQVKRLAEAFRQARLPVIYLVHVVRPDYSDARFPWRRLGLPRDGDRTFIVEGTWGARIVDELTPREEEHVVVKKGFDGFSGTTLDSILREIGVTTCVVAGVTTCVCISSTVRGGVEHNYRMAVVGDAVAERSRARHDAELATMTRTFADVTTVDELVDMLARSDFSRARKSRTSGGEMSGSAFDVLMEVSMGFTLPRTLHVIAELGIADALEDNPLTANALAVKTGTHPDALNRALRVLSAHGIFIAEGGAYRHSPASRLLRSDHPESVRSFVRMQGIRALWRVWEDFDYSIRTGRSAAEKSLPEGFWGYFAANPEHSQLFNDAMTSQTHAHTAGILNAYDFSAFATIGDIGGGNGHLLRQVLAACPKASGVLFDLPHVIEGARAIPSERIIFQSGSFFDDQLPVCDAYLMKIVIHDWNDHEASSILKAIRRSAPSHAKLVLAEFLVPEDGKPNWTLFVDLLMLGELTGKERTKSEFGNLLAGAGFKLDRVIDTRSRIFLLEASVA